MMPCSLSLVISDKYKHSIDTPLRLVCVYDFWSSPGGREQTESDAYEPTVQVTQVGSKMVLNYDAAWWMFWNYFGDFFYDGTQ